MPLKPTRRDKVAHGVEIGATGVAGTVGTALAAAKLRDAYKEDYPSRFAQHATRVEHGAHAVAPRAGRLARLASHGKPGFIPLAVGTGAAGIAATADKYQKHRARKLSKAEAGDKASYDVRQLGNRGEYALRRLASTDQRVLAARHRILPSTGQTVQLAADTKRKVLRKAEYDPDRRRRRNGKLLAVGAAAGSGYNVNRAIREVGAADRARAHRRVAMQNSERSFGVARHYEKQLDAQRASMLKPVGHEGNVGSSMRTRIKEMDSMEFSRRMRHAEGMHHFRMAQTDAHAIRGSLRRAGTRAGAAVVLGAGALKLRERHRR